MKMEIEGDDQNSGAKKNQQQRANNTLMPVNIDLNKIDFLDMEMDSTELKKMKQTVMAVMAQSENDTSNGSLLPGLNDDAALDVLAWCSRSDYPTLSCLNKRFKSLMSSGYLYKLRRQLGVIEHWIFLSCIMMPWEAYNPVRNRWMRLPVIPCDDCFNYADKESLAVGTQLLVFGRELLGFAIYMYSLCSKNWSRCTPMKSARCLFASGSVGELAIIAGGTDKNGGILKSAELFNSKLGTWETLPDMNTPRKLCSGVFMDGKFYAIGGMSTGRDSLTCGEEFNMETRTWRRIENMYPSFDMESPPAMCSPPLIAVVNNELYSADLATNEVKKYNKVNNTWRVVKSLPVRAGSCNGWGVAFRGVGNKLMVIGGQRRVEGEAIVMHAWEPDADGEGQDWNMVCIKRQAGAFVYNCAIMGC